LKIVSNFSHRIRLASVTAARYQPLTDLIRSEVPEVRDARKDPKNFPPILELGTAKRRFPKMAASPLLILCGSVSFRSWRARLAPHSDVPLYTTT
jgi:hypothetical protein